MSIIDVKHTSEANPSYSAEVALYALFLANWIADQGLQNSYFVTTHSYLWTRFKQGQSVLDGLMSGAASATPNQYLDALIDDSEDANLRFYLPTVLHFFREDLLRVIAVGDALPNGWVNLEWHVDGRCSACDWLEAACDRAFRIHAVTWRSIDSILRNKLDRKPREAAQATLPLDHANVRGAKYYH